MKQEISLKKKTISREERTVFVEFPGSPAPDEAVTEAVRELLINMLREQIRDSSRILGGDRA